MNCFPQFRKSDMSKYGYLEVFYRVLGFIDNESRLYIGRQWSKAYWAFLILVFAGRLCNILGNAVVQFILLNLWRPRFVDLISADGMKLLHLRQHLERRVFLSVMVVSDTIWTEKHFVCFIHVLYSYHLFTLNLILRPTIYLTYAFAIIT